MSCKNCSDKIHPLFIIIATIVIFAILVGIISFVMWIGWVTMFWLGVIALCIAFGKMGADAEEWYRNVTKR